jgi:hypothetical protein
LIVNYELFKGRVRGGTLLATFPNEAMATGAMARLRVVEEENPKGYRGVYSVVRVEIERRGDQIMRRRTKFKEHARPRSDVKMAILRLLGASHADRNPQAAPDLQGPPVQRPDDVWSLRAFLGYERQRSADLPVYGDAGS